MSDKMYCFTCLVGLFMSLSLVNGNAVSFINKCKASDGKCIKDNIVKSIPLYVKGIPELKVAPLDPVTIAKMDASRSGLKFLLTDVVVTGLSTCTAKKASRDVEKGKLMIKFLCDAPALDGQYELNGQLLILPIEGKGGIHVLLRKAVINIEVDMGEKEGPDGKKHWDVLKFKHSFELKDKADVVFENLFNGNELLGRAARDLITENGNDVVREIGPPVIKAVVVEVVKSIKNFFMEVPIEDLSLDV